MLHRDEIRFANLALISGRQMSTCASTVSIFLVAITKIRLYILLRNRDGRIILRVTTLLHVLRHALMGTIMPAPITVGIRHDLLLTVQPEASRPVHYLDSAAFHQTAALCGNRP